MKTKETDRTNDIQNTQKEEGNQSFLKFLGIFFLIVGAICVAAHFLFLA